MPRNVGRPRKEMKDILPSNWEEQVYKLSLHGKSECQIRRDLCVVNGKFTKGLWYAFKERYQDFSAAIQIGKQLSQAWWEDCSQANLTSQHFQTGSWYANMKNRFGWRDQQEFTHRGRINLIIQTPKPDGECALDGYDGNGTNRLKDVLTDSETNSIS